MLYSDQGRNLEFRQPLLLGEKEFGSIRIGVSTLLIRDELNRALTPALVTAAVALAVAVFGAIVLAQLFLRPIHVIRSGLTRLGRGEFGVKLDLKQDDEFGELGTFFNAVSAQLSADRSQMAGQVANLESAVELLEDAVAIVNSKGALLFANPAFRSLLPTAAAGVALNDLVATDHPLRRLAEETLAMRQARGPLAATFSVGKGEHTERLISAHPVNDSGGLLVGIMLTVRNLEYLTQVQSTVRYSRKLAALGRLSAGVAHEVKNPLNAMMIHLELLRQKFMPRPMAVGAAARGTGSAGGEAPSFDTDGANQHVNIIAGEIRRLDEVVQGFLKFSRPEDLKLQPIALSALFGEVILIVRPEAEKNRVQLGVRMRRGDRGEWRPGHVASGLSQPGAERLSGHAWRRHAPDHLRGGAGAPRRHYDCRHRHRHQARTPQTHLRSLLHHQGGWQRDRPLNGLSDGADARRGN